jgi:acyl carrier protein
MTTAELSPQSVRDAVLAKVAGWGIDPSEVNESSELSELADSANQMRAGAELEQELGVRFIDPDNPAQTVGDLVNQIIAKA